MAYPYNSFNGYPYPMQQYQQQQYQPMQQQAMQQPTQTAVQMQSGIMWVNDYNEAAMYPVAPNSAVALWDKNSPSIYLKKSDMTGKPTMTIYDLVERQEQPQTRGAADNTRYATQEAVDGLSRIVDDLKHQLEDMRLKSAHSTSKKEAAKND